MRKDGGRPFASLPTSCSNLETLKRLSYVLHNRADKSGRRKGKAFWSLLHVTVCLPDICAALESDDGRTGGKRYVDWCNRHLPDARLSGEERYWMRCKILHEGRATGRASTGRPGRYSGFAFTQPAANGQIDHRRVDGSTLVLEVGKLSEECKAGVQRWIQAIEADPTGQDANNVQKNLPTVVRVRQKPMPAPSMPAGVVWNNRTS
jgi:hypothetical protein